MYGQSGVRKAASENKRNFFFCLRMILYIFRAKSEYTQISLATCYTIFIFIMYIVYNIYCIV